MFAGRELSILRISLFCRASGNGLSLQKYQGRSSHAVEESMNGSLYEGVDQRAEISLRGLPAWDPGKKVTIRCDDCFFWEWYDEGSGSMDLTAKFSKQCRISSFPGFSPVDGFQISRSIWQLRLWPLGPSLVSTARLCWWQGYTRQSKWAQTLEFDALRYELS